jgi:hypothetical protein
VSASDLRFNRECPIIFVSATVFRGSEPKTGWSNALLGGWVVVVVRKGGKRTNFSALELSFHYTQGLTGSKDRLAILYSLLAQPYRTSRSPKPKAVEAEVEHVLRRLTWWIVVGD